MVHTTIVSRNVPVMETSPCRTGSFVCAAAAAIGADPRPASFENMPRAMPFCMAATIAPTAPPAAACQPKADFTISAIAAGTFAMLQQTRTSAKTTYRTTISGITFSLTFAMRLSPPMTTMPTMNVSRMDPNIVAQE